MKRTILILNGYTTLTRIASRVHAAIISVNDVSRLGPIRRGTCLFMQGQPADAAYLIEDGLVKQTRTSEIGSRIISAICGAGHLLGEEALADEAHYTMAETMTTAVVYRVPRESLRRLLASDSEVAMGLMTYVLARNKAAVEKGELLCLYDVEYRILYYLAELAQLVTPLQDGQDFQLPLTQLELADLIGATRETTSTTLNHMERRGLIKLSRRLMTVPSPVTLMEAAKDRLVHQNSLAAAGR